MYLLCSINGLAGLVQLLKILTNKCLFNEDDLSKTAFSASCILLSAVLYLGLYLFMERDINPTPIRPTLSRPSSKPKISIELRKSLRDNAQSPPDNSLKCNTNPRSSVETNKRAPQHPSREVNYLLLSSVP